jgi:hypothetical protein
MTAEPQILGSIDTAPRMHVAFEFYQGAAAVVDQGQGLREVAYVGKFPRETPPFSGRVGDESVIVTEARRGLSTKAITILVVRSAEEPSAAKSTPVA